MLKSILDSDNGKVAEPVVPGHVRVEANEKSSPIPKAAFSACLLLNRLFIHLSTFTLIDFERLGVKIILT